MRKLTKNLAVMVSGGRSSAMMARHIQTSPAFADYKKTYVFCNTGMERPETIQFLLDMTIYWKLPLVLIEGVYSTEIGVGVKHKIVSFDTLDMTGAVFSQMITQLNKYKNTGVPNMAKPYCSDYLKTRPAHDYCRDYFKSTTYIKALGFRAEDMPKRITFAELREDPFMISPLLTDFTVPISNLALNDFFLQEKFKLNLHSKWGNCELCFKKSTSLLVATIQKGTRFIDWHRDHEQLYGDTFFRGKQSINDLISIATSGVQLPLFDENKDGCVCNFK